MPADGKRCSTGKMTAGGSVGVGMATATAHQNLLIFLYETRLPPEKSARACLRACARSQKPATPLNPGARYVRRMGWTFKDGGWTITQFNAALNESVRLID